MDKAKIDKLYEQAHVGKVFNRYRFARLIVEECADYISETATIETLLGDRLKEHFGVEE